MNFTNPELCKRLFELTRKTTHFAWDCTGAKPTIVVSNGVYATGHWPAYTLGDLYRMNPRATTWFKKETSRLGGLYSCRTDGIPHFAARGDVPEDTAAELQIAVFERRVQDQAGRYTPTV